MNIKLCLLQLSFLTVLMIFCLNLLDSKQSVQNCPEDDGWPQNIVHEYFLATENGTKHKNIAKKWFKVNLAKSKQSCFWFTGSLSSLSLWPKAILSEGSIFFRITKAAYVSGSWGERVKSEGERSAALSGYPLSAHVIQKGREKKIIKREA